LTQYEGVATCEKISEAFLIPVLEALLQSFPFVILGFHTDNGSEYINHHVAKLLNTLLIEEQTKSRSRHSNDNAQAESKNGAIVRKHLGYSHIPQRFAAPVNAFCRDYLNPYINFHRPCLFAETITDAKGRQRKRYPYQLMMTPYEKLKSLPLAENFLKPGTDFKILDAQAGSMSDNEAAQRLNNARAILFKTICNRSKTAA
jgi:transposase InsO family protein